MALISVNILIIFLISLSTIIGFFQITAEWESGIITDITALINQTLAKEFPDVDSIEELNKTDFESLLEKTMKFHKGRLTSISFYSNNGNLLYSKQITEFRDVNKQGPFKIELIRLTAELRRILYEDKAELSGILVNNNYLKIGNVKIASSPLMGYKYTGLFDRIITRLFFIGIISASIISLVISFFLSKKLSRHSKTFAAQITNLAEGRRDLNFTRGSTVEMKSSAEAAESLQALLKNNEEVQLRKLQDIIHDLKTPVAAIGIQFEAINDGVLKIDDERIKLLSSEFGIIEEIIAELARYTTLASNDYTPTPESFDLNILISEVEKRFRIQSENNNQILDFKHSEVPCMIKTDRLGIMRVLNNLTVNALNNAPEKSRIEISTGMRKHMIHNSDILIIEIENEGHIDDSDLPFVFDRLYRSKKSGYHGSGLGLAISKAIVEKNNGRLIAINTAYNTVVFRIELPLT